MITGSTKDAQRQYLASLVEEKLAHEPEAVTVYAAKRPPDTKPYTKKPTASEQAFKREIEKMRAVGAHQDESIAPPAATTGELTLEDFPGLAQAASTQKF